MSDTVRLSSKLAKDDDLNGLDSTVETLKNDGKTPRIAVIWYDVDHYWLGVDVDEKVPYVRIRRWEPVGSATDMPDGLRQLVEEAAQERTGKLPLPYDAVEGFNEDDA